MVASGYNSEVVRSQGATAIIIGSSGEVRFEAGGELYGLTKDIVFNLRGGVVASASGAADIIASAKNPGYARVNGTTDPTQRVRWSTAAGTTTPVQFPTVAIPDDFDKTVAAQLRLYGEGGSAQSDLSFTASVFFGVGAGNAGATTPTFTSAPSEKALALTTANQTSVGPLTLVLAPNAHTSGVLDLYAAKITYKARSRAT
jgi:hypothetical protein